MDIQSTLQDFGLTDTESDIYLSLVRRKRAVAADLAHDITIPRTSIYYLLKKLKKEGYVLSQHRDGTTYYYPQPIRRVAAMHSRKLDALYGVMPMIEMLSGSQQEMPSIRYIDSLDELKQYYTIVLDEYMGSSYDIIGSALAWEGHDPDWFRVYRRRRARNNIKTRLLLTSDSKGISPDAEGLLRTVKYLPEKYIYKSTIDIFNNEVLIIGPNIGALALVISIPSMCDVFQATFDALWDSLPESE